MSANGKSDGLTRTRAATGRERRDRATNAGIHIPGLPAKIVSSVGRNANETAITSQARGLGL